MASDVAEAKKAEAELLRQLEACEEEAKKPRPAPPPQQYIRGIPVGHAPAGMPPDPCADLRKRYAEAKKAHEDAVDLERTRAAEATNAAPGSFSNDLVNRIKDGIEDVAGPADVDTMRDFGKAVQDIKTKIANGEDPGVAASKHRDTVEKVEGISPQIRKSMQVDIRSALRESGSSLSEEERDFWTGVEDALSDPAEWYNSVLTAKPS